MREAIPRRAGDDGMARPHGQSPGAMAAERLGKEAGLFVVSGTMGNLVSLTHCPWVMRSSWDHAHIFLYEAGGPALAAPWCTRCPTCPPGCSTPQVEAARDPTALSAEPRYLPENMHNRCGAPPSRSSRRNHQGGGGQVRLRMHLDGARIQRAVALGTRSWRPLDSVQFCFKASRRGSAIVGLKEFIEQARRTARSLAAVCQSGIRRGGGGSPEQMVDACRHMPTRAG